MLTLEQIIEGLQDRNLKAVAGNIDGVGYQTLYLIASGKQTNPRYTTLKALSDYLEGKTNG